jgi:hypothetical protein
MTAPILCQCGARIARGYGGRLVHMTAPVGKPHYAVAKPTARVAEHETSPRARSATPAAGRSGIRGH